jgi:hypothetical protein
MYDMKLITPADITFMMSSSPSSTEDHHYLPGYVSSMLGIWGTWPAVQLKKTMTMMISHEV